MSSSGRGVLSKKDRVDQVLALDILRLQKQGILVKYFGTLWTESWQKGEQTVGRIGLRVLQPAPGVIILRFEYTITSEITGKTEEWDYPVAVVTTSCHFGGVRYWYICPLVVEGRVCSRRCRILYLPPGAKYFGCRECYQLTYESRQKHRDRFYAMLAMVDRAEERLAKARSPRAIAKAREQMDQAESTMDDFVASETKSDTMKYRKRWNQRHGIRQTDTGQS